MELLWRRNWWCRDNVSQGNAFDYKTKITWKTPERPPQSGNKGDDKQPVQPPVSTSKGEFIIPVKISVKNMSSILFILFADWNTLLWKRIVNKVPSF